MRFPVRARGPLSFSLLTSTIVQGINVLTGVILARSLGPAGRGQLAAAMLWPSVLATLGSLGIVESTTYFSARKTRDLGRLVGTALVVGVIQSAFLIALGAVIVRYVVDPRSDAVALSAYIFLAFIPLYLLTMYLMAVINGIQRFRWFHGLRLTVILGSGVLIGVLAIGGKLTVVSAVATYLIAHLIAGLAAWILVATLRIGRLSFSKDAARTMLSFGIRSHVGSVAGTLNERLDQLVISVFLPVTQLGLYVVAVSFTSVTALVGASVSLVALPAIAGFDEGQLSERAAAARRYVSLTLWASAAVTVPLFFLLPHLILWFFGPSFVPAVQAARILLIATVFLGTGRVLQTVLRGLALPQYAGIGEGIAVIATGLGLAVLLPMLGIVGAGLTSLGAYIVSMVWMTRRVARQLQLPAMSLLAPPGGGWVGGSGFFRSLRRD